MTTHTRPLPPEVALPLAAYRLLSPLVAAAMLPGFVRRLLRRGGWQEHFGQRFGWFSNEEKAQLATARWTWIHSISVGETLVALKLARALQALEPGIPIALSVTTSTGYALAAGAASDTLRVMYNPVDAPAPVAHVLHWLRPERVVLVEGEVWPNLMAACWERGIPVMLANARLSPRSAARFARFRRWCAPFFGMLEWIGIPDAEDQPRWENVGVASENLRLTGSIKFDQGAGGASEGRLGELRGVLARLGWEEGAPLVVAGSTHDGEEVLLARAFQRWRREHPGLRLVVVPRHVERAPALAREVEAEGVRVVRRSLWRDAQGEAGVLLVDRTGELRDWYALATVTFVGKSLTAEGGQNPVEPALAGKPVVFGPHMENFEVVVRHLLAGKAAIQVANAEEMETQVARLLGNEAERQGYGARAREVLEHHQGAAARTAALVLGRAG
ncbi:MAG: 3-deoxy-D-manno-octulosonic acid transferase [Verrucomicrobiota bacterium]